MTWRTFVAVGDSFTEGVGDPDPATGTERGWADRVAERLAATPRTCATPTWRYAGRCSRPS